MTPDSSMDRWQAMAQTGLFGMAFVMAKEVQVSSKTVVLTMLVDFAQMLAFPINSSPAYPWRSPEAGSTVVGTVSRALSFITPDTLDQVHSAGTFLFVFIIAMLWTAAFIGLAAWVAWSFSQRMPQVALVLRALRSVAWLSTTVLFLPFAAVLMRGLACPDKRDWMGTGMPCWQGGHMALTVLQALLLPCFIALSLFTASVFINRDVRRPAADSKVDGRVDVAMLAVKVVLSAVYNIPDSTALRSWAVVLLVLASGVVWPALMQLHRPFITPAMNDLQTGLGAGYLWACIMLVFAKLGSPGTDFSVAMLAGMAISVAAGAAISHVRQQRTQARPLNKLRSVYDFHVWAAMKLEQARQLEGLDDSTVREAAEGRLGSLPLLLPSGGKRALLPQGDEDRVTGAERAGCADEEQRGRDVASRRRGRSSRVAPAPALAEGVRARADKEDRDAASSAELPYKERLVAGLRAQAELAYVEMVRQHPHSAVAHVLAAQFFRLFHDNKYMEMATLNKARTMSPALDVRFFVHQRTQQLREEADGERSGEDGARERRAGLSPIDRVLFDQQWAECRRLYKTAYRQMLALWDTLREHVPDLLDIQRTGVELQRVLERMQQLYTSMLTINPESTAVLRSYAEFLFTLAGDQARAMEAVNKADRLDEVHAKQQSRVVQHVVLGSEVAEQLSVMDDKAATVTFSGDTASLGEVLSVSNAATAVFGYTKLQLVGQHFGTLMPPPLRAAFVTMLRDFARTGRGLLFGASRVMLGQAKAGHIFPMYLTMREAPPGRNSLAPRFVAVMRPVQSYENYVLVAGPHTQFRVHAACPRTLQLLGLDAEALSERLVSAEAALPGLSGSVVQGVPVWGAAAAASSSAIELGTGMQRDGGTLSQLVRVEFPELDLRRAAGAQVTALRTAGGSELVASVRSQLVPFELPEPAWLLTWRPMCLNPAASERVLASAGGDDGGSTSTLRADQMLDAWSPCTMKEAVAALTSAATVGMQPRRYGSYGTAALAVELAAPDLATASSDSDESQEGDEEGDEGGAHAVLVRDVSAGSNQGLRAISSALAASSEMVPVAGNGSDSEQSDSSTDRGAKTGAGDALRDALAHNGAAATPSRSEVPSTVIPGLILDASTPPSLPADIVRSPAAGGAPVFSSTRALMGDSSPLPRGQPKRAQLRQQHVRSGGRQPRAASHGSVSEMFGEGSLRVKTQVKPRSQRPRGLSRHRSLDSKADSRSEGVSSEASSRTTIMNRLRRNLQSRAQQREPEVKLMHRGLWANVIVVVAIAILIGVGFGSQRDQMTQQYLSLRRRMDRLTRLEQSITSLRIAAVAAGGLPLFGTEEFHVTQFFEQMEHFDELHRAITARNALVGSNSVLASTAIMVAVMEPRVGLPPVQYNMTLPRVGNFVVTKARDIVRDYRASGGGPAFWAANQDARTLQVNYDNIERALLDAAHAAHLDFLAVSRDMQNLLIALFASIFAVTLTSSTLLYVRAIRSLKRRANSMLLLFLRIPRHVVKAAREQALRRYEGTIAQELEVEAAAEADKEQQGSAPSPSARAQSMAEASALRIEPDVSGHDEVDGVDWQQVLGVDAQKQPAERARRHRDSSTFVLRSTIFTLLPLLAVALWGVGIQLGQQQVVDTSIISARRMLLVQLQTVEAYNLVTEANTLVGSTVAHERLVAQEFMDRAAAMLTELLSRLLQGGRVPSMHHTFGAAFQMQALDTSVGSMDVRVLMHDGCLGTSDYERCRGALGGVFNNGFAAAISTFSSLTRSLAFGVDVLTNNTESLVTPEVLDKCVRMINMENPFMRDMFNTTATAFHEAANNVIERGVDIQVAVAVVFVVLFTLSILIFFRPMASNMAAELRSSRSLLLVIPEQVVHHLPQLREGVQQVLLKGEVELDETEESTKTRGLGARVHRRRWWQARLWFRR